MELFFFVSEDLVPDPPDDSDFVDELEDPELLSDFAEDSVFVSPLLAVLEASPDEPEESEELESPDDLVLADDERASFL